MTDYQELKVKLKPASEDAFDLAASLLADIGYESFVTEPDFLLAYIAAESFNLCETEEVFKDFPMAEKVSLSSRLIEGQNWNEEWEKNYFQPIVISDRCVIHSSFHKDIPSAEYDIVIDPRMAFGTGHHATTALILDYLLTLPLVGKKIIDMGTGTAILSILCKMLGAESVTGIEIDPDAFANAVDNVKLNRVEVNLILGDASKLIEATKNGCADLLIANINRNIVIADMDRYVKALKYSGELILSGFYETDVPLVQERAQSLGFIVEEIRTGKDWAALRLVRTKNGQDGLC